MKFKVVEENGKKAIYSYDDDWNLVGKIADGFDEIENEEYIVVVMNLNMNSNVPILAKKDGKWAMYNFSNNGLVKISDDYDHIHSGSISSPYFIASNKKTGLKDKILSMFGIDKWESSLLKYENGNIKEVAKGFANIQPYYGLLAGETNKFIAKSENGGYAIYENNNDQITKITPDFDYIRGSGYVSGVTNYILAMNDGKFAIYKKDGDEIRKITPDYEWIDASDLLEGKTNRFTAEKDGRKVVFEINSETPIKVKKDYESDYYIKKDKFGKVAIYYEDNKGTLYKISENFDYIYAPGMNDLVKGETPDLVLLSKNSRPNYFIGKKNGKEAIYLNTEDGIKKISEDFDYIDKTSFRDFVFGRTDTVKIYHSDVKDSYKIGNRETILKIEGENITRVSKYESDYFVKKEKGKESIYFEDEKGATKKIAEFDEVFNYEGVFKSGGNNYVLAKKDGKWAIYEVRRDEIHKLTKDFDNIYANKLLKGESNEFTAFEGKKAMKFRIDGKEVERSSNFIIEEKRRFFGAGPINVALYQEIDGKKVKIADGFGRIDAKGLTSGVTDTFIGRDFKDAIYKVQNGQAIKVSPDFDYIEGIGFEEGKTNLFKGNINGKEAIYKYENGQVTKITNDFNWINNIGLLSGQSNFFVAEKRDMKGLYKYENGEIVTLIDRVDEIRAYDLLEGKSNTFEVLIDYKWETYKYENGEIIKIEKDREQNKYVEKSTKKEINNGREDKPIHKRDETFGMCR